MKFSKREDIEAPATAVFAALSDFNAFSRSAMRRGIEVSRADYLDAPAPGMAWAVRAPVRGRLRDIALRLTGWDPGQRLQLAFESGGLIGSLDLDLLVLSRTRTRLTAGLELRAVTVASRLLLQSARLAKGNLDRRFARRLSDFARDIEIRAGGRRSA